MIHTYVIRRLTADDDPSRVVIVMINTPYPDRDGDWMCQYVVDARPFVAYGLDALQALLNAIDGARVKIEALGLKLSWVGGEPGDHGIPQTVPSYFGRAFAETIERFIEQQIRAFVAAAESKRDAGNKH